MKNVIEHIEYVKGKPHHVRRKVAVTTAAIGSALVALVWLGVSTATGVFAIQGSSYAASTGSDATLETTDSSDTTALAGAAAALPPTPSASAPAHIEIVDTTPAPAPQKQADQTILPF